MVSVKSLNICALIISPQSVYNVSFYQSNQCNQIKSPIWEKFHRPITLSSTILGFLRAKEQCVRCAETVKQHFLEFFSIFDSQIQKKLLRCSDESKSVRRLAAEVNFGETTVRTLRDMTCYCFLTRSWLYIELSTHQTILALNPKVDCMAKRSMCGLIVLTAARIVSNILNFSQRWQVLHWT